MLQFQIAGLERLTSLFGELGDAIKQLNGGLCEVRFDASKPEQVQAAIQAMQDEVDERLSEFQDKPLVHQFTIATKQNFREEILKRAAESRRRPALNAIPFDPLNGSAFFGNTAVTESGGWNSARPMRRRTP